MKLETIGTLNVERYGDVEEIALEVANTSTIYKIMSVDMYKNAPKAIVRELCANAVDSHREAGTSHIPYTMHLPTTLEPEFILRDYGTGMNQQKIRDVYMKLGESPKNQSNDYIGCLGIGSKSPFAYRGAFNLNSYYNGTLFSYAFYHNEKGFPVASLLGTTPTEEPNGIEIQFPVELKDINKFHYEAKHALKYFKQRPQITGPESFEFDPEPKYFAQTPEFAIFEEKSYESTVVMGSIGYRFHSSDFANSEFALDENEKHLVDWGINLFVPIGSVCFTPNREELLFNDQTKATLKALIGKAAKLAHNEAMKTLEQAQTIWEARCLYGKLRNSVVGQIANMKDTTLFNWQGKNISNIICLGDYKPRPKVELIQLKPFGGRRRRYRDEDTTTRPHLYRSEEDSFDVLDVQNVIVNDMEHGGNAAARRYLENNPQIKRTFMINSAGYVEFNEEIGWKHLFLYTSQMPKPERASYGSYSRGSVDRSLMRKWENGKFENVEIDLSEGGVYVEVRWDKVKVPHSYQSEVHTFQEPDCISKTINNLNLLGFSGNVYGIRPCDIAKIHKYRHRWVELYDYVGRCVKQNEWLLPYLVAAKTSESFSKELLQIKDLSDCPTIKAAIDAMEQCMDTSRKYMYEKRAFEALNAFTSQYTIAGTLDVQNEIQKVYRQFPLLKYIIGEATNKEVKNYIELVLGK